MTVSTLKIGKTPYAVIPMRDFERMRKQLEKATYLAKQERGDIAEAKRRSANPKERLIPWAEVKRKAGLE